MNIAANQEKEKNEKTSKRKAEKEKTGRSISKKLRAVLLQLSRWQHGEKMVCVRGVPGVTGTLGKANSYFDPIQTGWGTTAAQFCLLCILYTRQKFRTSLFRKTRVSACFVDGQKVRIDD